MSWRISTILLGIVARLRALILLAIGLILLLLVIGLWQSNTLQKAQEVLSTDSVPFLIETQNVQQAVTNLSGANRRIRSVVDFEGLNPIESTFKRESARLEAASQVITEQNLTNIDTHEFEQLLIASEARGRLIFEKKSELLSLMRRLDQMRALVEDEIDKMKFTAEALVFERTNSTSSLFGKLDQKNTPLVSTDTAGSLSEAYWEALNLSELLTDLSGFSDVFRGMARDANSDELQKAQAILLFRTNALVKLISRLAPTTGRTEIAKEILSLLELLQSNSGIFAISFEVNDLNAEILDLLVVQQRDLDRVSVLSSGLVKQSLAGVAASFDQLERNSSQLTFGLTLTGILTILFLALVSYMVVERQIGQRMANLTESVQAISAGNLSFPIKTNGDDEIGQIADSLRVFKANAQELERSNTDLERFAYVAAHDLRSPLSAIHDLALWTMDDPDNHLSEESKENLDLLNQRVQRLSNLLTDLLKYSRAGRDRLVADIIEFPEFVDEQIDMLDIPAGFEIIYIGEDIKAFAYILPIRQVMWNLVNNSIKHHDKNDGQVMISATVSDGLLKLVISDDGPGIAPKFHRRVFELFQTLKSRDEVEGSGLGLAIVRKLVEACGGNIRIESDPNQSRGTTFIAEFPEMSSLDDKKLRNTINEGSRNDAFG